MTEKLTPTFAGELQLAGWSESHTGGCKVTFWLSSPDELTAFRALTVRKGNTAGHRFMAALVEIGDDEKPVDNITQNAGQTSVKPLIHNEKPGSTSRAPMGDACYRTVMWCQESLFWCFLNQTERGFEEVTDAREAAAAVRFMCGVGSRKDLDTDNEANKTWHRKIREPYRLYLASLGQS